MKSGIDRGVGRGWRALAGLLGAVALGSVMVPSAGCSGSAGVGTNRNPPDAQATQALGASGHAIHVFAVQPDGTKKRFDFGQGTEIGPHVAGKVPIPMPSSGGSQPPPLGSGLHGLAAPRTAGAGLHTLDFADGGTQLVGGPTVDAPGNSELATAWALVVRAQDACWGSEDRSVDTATIWGQSDGFTRWFDYDQGGSSCSERLDIEQNLLCAADKLAEVGDAVGTTVWPALSTLTCQIALQNGFISGNPFLYGSGITFDFCDEWDIPPQADADRFIVRDLAIHLIGQLATIDGLNVSPFSQTVISGSTTTTTTSTVPKSDCATMLSGVQQGTISVQTDFDALTVFGVRLHDGSGNPTFPVYPPSDLPVVDSSNTNNSPQIARSAMQVEGQILRGAGRLLHDVIRRDVYSDMAAAAQQRARALDPDQGNQLAWGVGPLSQGPYGAIAHAARVLTGRWEVGDGAGTFNGHGDPEPEEVHAIDVLPKAFGGNAGNELSARYEDRAIRTKGEALASSLVESTGIVLPTCTLSASQQAGAGGGPSVPTAQALRSALVAQLVLQEQTQNQLPAPPPRQVFVDTLARVSDAELQFAFARALRTFRLLTDSPDAFEVNPGQSCAPVTLTGGLQSLPAAQIDPSVTALQGVVIDGGIYRSRITMDPIARSGGMLEVSQMYLQYGPGNETQWGTTDFDPAANNPTGFENRPQPALPAGVFQDAFSMGQSIERRLVLLDQASLAGEVMGPGDPEPIARSGVAELRAWAGGATVLAQGFSGDSGSGVFVETSGIEFADVGLDPSMDAATRRTTMMGAFGFVYGPPWVAECAAHLRKDCPSNFDTQWVQHPIDANDSGTDTSLMTQFGAQTPIMQLNLPYFAGDPNLVPNFAPTPQFGNGSHLYMILLHDRSSPTAQGRVLGVISTAFIAFDVPIVGFVIAPMQRELLDAVIDTGQWIGSAPPRISGLAAADSSGYCVDGVPRDIFVPLQNELTADDSQSFENSWKHYLTVAQQAATTADQLAQQLIANDLQIEQRTEAAGELVADACGDVGAIDKISIDGNGHVTPAANDTALSSCFNEPTTDIVFMSDIPDPLNTNSPNAAPNPTTWIQQNVLHCNAQGASDPLCTHTSYTFDTFKVVEPHEQATPGRSACGGLSGILDSLSSGFHDKDFGAMLGDPSFQSSAIAGLASGLKLTVDQHDHWSLSYLTTTPLMDSQNTNLWPACHASSGGCSNVPSAAVFDKAFRYCPGADRTTAALGCSAPSAGAELNMIRWRVSGALWMIAASAGELEGGMFNIPVPVVTWPPTTPSSTAVFVGAAYSGRLIGNGTAGQWQMDPSLSRADNNALPLAYDVDPAFTSFGSSAPQEIPAWYTSLYAANTPAKHVLASNTSMVWPNCVLAHALNLPQASSCSIPQDQDSNDFITSTIDQTPPSPLPISLLQILNGGSVSLQGYTCSAPFGGSSVTGPAIGGWTYALGDLITALNTGFNTLQTGVYDFFPHPSLETTCEWSGAGSGVTTKVNGQVVSLSCGSDWPSSNNPHPNPLWQVDMGPPGTGNPFGGGGGVGAFGAPVSVFNPTIDGPTTASLGQVAGFQSEPNYLAASALQPKDRVFAFAHLTAGNGTCAGLAQMLGAVTLGCAVQGANASTVGPPPPVNHLSQIPVLQDWLDAAGRTVRLSAQQLYVENVPKRVVADVQSGEVGSGNKAGTHGTDILNMEQAVQDLASAWVTIGTDLSEISAAIGVAQASIQLAGAQEGSAEAAIAIQRINVESQMAQGITALVEKIAEALPAVAGCAFTGVACAAVPLTLASIGETAVTTAQNVSAGNAVLDALGAEAKSTNQTFDAQVLQAVASLNASTPGLWSTVQTSLDSMRKAVLTLQQATADLQLTTAKAQYQAAIAAGSDFVVLASTGQEIPIPVNTVLRRQQSATEIRYRRALDNAKALAYMARRAIEQRLGVPLSALTTRVGPLDAPASWADDVCSLTGVNLQALNTATPLDAGGADSAAEQTVIDQFANDFVGDYVAKLSSFVDYFNAQYPSHEGNDTAILSLRQTLLDPVPTCTQLSPNLLLNSGSLDTLVTPQLAATEPGWALTPCARTATKCLSVLSGSLLPAPQDGPQGPVQTASGSGAIFSGDATGVTWLNDLPATPSDAGADAATASDGGEAGAPLALPPGVVSQTVTLDVGSYVLSWWDQARDATGKLLSPGSTPAPYVATVYDPSWQVVAQATPTPNVPMPSESGATATLWSPRNALTFQVPVKGSYHVAFGASTATSGPGSVAIADVQLEQTQASNVPTVYIGTTSTRMVTQYSCTPSDVDLRNAFQHNCDLDGTCHYDLVAPIVIDTTALNAGGSRLAGKLAQGNYNYRHIDVSVNLVGTGVRDCSSTPNSDCFGTGYIEYDLQHDGTNAGITDYNGDTRFFDFGIAGIQHGKALAAERYITMPLSMADQSLIAQPGIQHVEFRGRPLDGTYHLRIWDSPALKWSQLQDVQIILDYRYWSEIVANLTGTGQGL